MWVRQGAQFHLRNTPLSVCLHSCDLANGSNAGKRQGKKCFSLWYWLSKPRRHYANRVKNHSKLSLVTLVSEHYSLSAALLRRKRLPLDTF